MVVGVADGDSEIGVCAAAGVFGVVAECAEDPAGRELEDVGVVDVVCVGWPSGDFTLDVPFLKSI